MIAVTNQILAVLLLVVAFAPDGAWAEKFETFEDYYRSRHFDKSFDRRLLVSAMGVGEDKSQACILTVEVTPLGRAKQYIPEFVTVQLCKADRSGICEDVEKCLARKGPEFGTRLMPIHTERLGRGGNRHKTVCWATGRDKTKASSITLVNHQGKNEEYCLYGYRCDPAIVPKAQTTVCPKWVDQAGNTVCPQLEDCINADLTMPTLTEDQFDALNTTDQKKHLARVEKQIEKVAEICAATEQAAASAHAEGTSSVKRPSKGR